MYVVLGASGHVGSAVAASLIEAGDPVTVVLRDPRKADRWRAKGADVAIADVGDADALRSVFWRGERAFPLNPPAPVTTDIDAEERRTFASIVRALDGLGLRKVVAQSTYGAQPGKHIGDLGVLHEFEQALASQPIPVTVLRGAYYMSNWDPLLAPARQGTLPSMFSADLAIPMVAPADLGTVAARLMREPAERTGIHHVEGPARHSPRDVADAFAKALHRPVDVAVTPREQWIETYRGFGFSEEAAISYAGMTAISVDGGFDMPADPMRGPTSLTDYVARMVAAGGVEPASA